MCRVAFKRLPERYNRLAQYAYLDNERGPAGHEVGRDGAERAVLDGHDLQVGAQRELEGQRVQVQVVVQVQRLEVLQRADLLRQRVQVVLADVLHKRRRQAIDVQQSR